ncbi:hypothetical protein ACK8P5_16575 [Paenibacillus sp. EC2-1]|uniref:hypothetical protein n=1 Tax=Paenibacillus sp. EC2-1 TaxID=3388665 RepID=UPI003BEF31A4
MSNKENSHQTEQERVQVLNSWRTPENSRHIDAAIASEEAPEDAALRILRASMKQQETTEQMVALAKKYRR